MYLCFYSDAHLGDILLSNPFIKKICESNPNETFYQWSLYGNELVCGPVNLYYLENNNCTYKDNFKSGLAPEDFTDDTFLKQLFIKNHNTSIFHFNYREKDYIALNTWCIPLGCETDINLVELVTCYNRKIIEINDRFNTNLKINTYESWELMPYFKNVSIDSFVDWKNKTNNYKELIFIYNYVPRLVKINIDINNFIKHICNLYKNSIIIVPLYNDLLNNITNIKFCDRDFDCNSDIYGNNLLKIKNINNYCNTIIALPTGGSWMLFNSDLKDNKKKIYMLGNQTYVDKLNKWYQIASNETSIISIFSPNTIIY